MSETEETEGTKVPSFVPECSGLLNLSTLIGVISHLITTQGDPVKRKNFSAEFKRESAQFLKPGPKTLTKEISCRNSVSEWNRILGQGHSYYSSAIK
jgi:hypothetical protein